MQSVRSNVLFRYKTESFYIFTVWYLFDLIAAPVQNSLMFFRKLNTLFVFSHFSLFIVDEIIFLNTVSEDAGKTVTYNYISIFARCAMLSV